MAVINGYIYRQKLYNSIDYKPVWLVQVDQQ